jgi:hypothetical protein
MGISEPVQAVFYNDPQPDKILYQGLASLKLKDELKAMEIFDRLISFREKHFDDTIKIDFFAVSLPDMQVFDTDLDERNRIHCFDLQGLGNLGKGIGKDTGKAELFFEKVLEPDANHLGAIIHQRMCKMKRLF